MPDDAAGIVGGDRFGGEPPGSGGSCKCSRLAPYWQVASTYVGRPFSSWQGSLLSIVTLIVLVAGSIGAGMRQHNLLAFCFAFALLSFGLAIHMAQQFAHPRAHLTPGFRRVHAVVAAAMAVVVTLAVPAVITWITAFRSIGLVALATVIFGAMLFLLLDAWAYPGLLVTLGILVSAFTPWGERFLQLFASQQSEPAVLGLFVVGLFLVAVGGVRLCGLNEEWPEYQALSALAARMAGGKVEENRKPSKGLSGWISRNQAERAMARTIRHARNAAISPWSRVLRWQVGLTGSTFVFTSVVFVSFCFGIWMVNKDLRTSDALFPAIFSSFIPQGMIWGEFWKKRAHLLSRELLLPVDRCSYFKQVGTAMVVRQFQAWIAVSLGIAVWVLVIFPKPLPPAELARALAVLALLQVWSFGLGAWSTRYRSFAPILSAYVLGFYVAFIPLGLGITPASYGRWNEMAVPAAAIMAVMGVAITMDAYRRWLVTDLG